MRTSITKAVQVAAILSCVGVAEAKPPEPLCSLLACEQPDDGTPFQKRFSLTDAEPCANVQVPTGRRLIVEYVAGAALVPEGKQLAGSMGGSISGGNSDDQISVPLAFSRESLFPGLQDRMVLSQTTSFHVGDGQLLNACLQALPLSDDSFEFSGTLTVTGVLESD